MRDTGAICFQFRTHDSAPSPRGPGNLSINTLGEGCGGTKRGRTGPNEFLSPPSHSEIYPHHTAACLTGGPVLASKADQGHPETPPSPARSGERDSAGSPFPSAAPQSHSGSPVARRQQLTQAAPLAK